MSNNLLKDKVRESSLPTSFVLLHRGVDEHGILEEEDLEGYWKFALLGQLDLTKYVKWVVS